MCSRQDLVLLIEAENKEQVCSFTKSLSEIIGKINHLEYFLHMHIFIHFLQVG